MRGRVGGWVPWWVALCMLPPCFTLHLPREASRRGATEAHAQLQPSPLPPPLVPLSDGHPPTRPAAPKPFVHAGARASAPH